MFELKFDEAEVFDQRTRKRSVMLGKTLRFEHSLFSISKWESEFEVPYFGRETKTEPQLLSYIKMMCLDEMTDLDVSRLTDNHLNTIADYISKKHSATWFSDQGQEKSRQIVTSELVYYWMIVHNIDKTCETWPIGRLMNLITICNIKAKEQAKSNKNTRSGINRQRLNERAALNAKRREALNSTG